MCRISLKTALCTCLVVPLLALSAFVTACSPAGEEASEEVAVEVAVDPGIERDAQLLEDTLPMIDYHRKISVAVVETIRNNYGIGPFASISIIDDSENRVRNEKHNIVVTVEIEDESGNTIIVALPDNRATIIVYPSDGSGPILCIPFGGYY